ncbi:hypothetical protein ACR9YC_08435 [Parasphingorhabdus sp. DH2-15]|uniref:hypothetical protein n=1 Tax=Parasphingorhabdus sp. DH2-15 TaxID=3444112 RepID=UPI003F6826FE
MSDTKPLASLSSGLLARKGAARPAMRRQNIMSAPAASSSTQDDLGWNDMGYDVDPPQSTGPQAIKPESEGEDERKAGILSAAIPEVVKQQDALQRNFANGNANAEAVPSETAESPLLGVEPDTVKSQGADEGKQPEAKPSITAKTADEEAIGKAAPAEAKAETVEPADKSDAIAPVNTSPLWSKPGADKAGAILPLVDDAPSVAEPSPKAEAHNIAEARSVLSKKPAKIQVKVDEKAKELERSEAALKATSAKPAAAKSTAVKAKSVKKRAASTSKVASGKRAAFTLRLDAQRHLRLRLACAIRNQSAQNMVTHALDEFLAGFPELDAMTGSISDQDGQAIT